MSCIIASGVSTPGKKLTRAQKRKVKYERQRARALMEQRGAKNEIKILNATVSLVPSIEGHIPVQDVLADSTLLMISSCNWREEREETSFDKKERMGSVDEVGVVDNSAGWELVEREPEQLVLGCSAVETSEHGWEFVDKTSFEN
jgi:hypothetical protein